MNDDHEPTYQGEPEGNSLPPSPGYQSPASTPPSVAGNEQPGFGQTTSQTPFNQQPLPQQNASRSRLGLWVGLGVVILLLVSLVAGFFVLKAVNDGKGQSYKKNAAAYLGDVKSKVDNAASFSDAQKAVDSIRPPQLSTTFLGNVSDGYKGAETAQKDVNAEIGKVKKDLSDFAGVEKFNTDYGNLVNKVQAVSDGIATSSSRATLSDGLTKLTSLIQEGKGIVDSAALPSELSSAKSSTSSVLSDEIANLKSMSAAFTANNSTAFYDAFSKFETAATNESAALKPINTYYYALDTKKNDMIKTIEDLRNKLVSNTSPANV